MMMMSIIIICPIAVAPILSASIPLHSVWPAGGSRPLMKSRSACEVARRARRQKRQSEKSDGTANTLGDARRAGPTRRQLRLRRAAASSSSYAWESLFSAADAELPFSSRWRRWSGTPPTETRSHRLQRGCVMTRAALKVRHRLQIILCCSRQRRRTISSTWVLMSDSDTNTEPIPGHCSIFFIARRVCSQIKLTYLLSIYCCENNICWSVVFLVWSKSF